MMPLLTIINFKNKTSDEKDPARMHHCIFFESLAQRARTSVMRSSPSIRTMTSRMPTALLEAERIIEEEVAVGGQAKESSEILLLPGPNQYADPPKQGFHDPSTQPQCAE